MLAVVSDVDGVGPGVATVAVCVGDGAEEAVGDDVGVATEAVGAADGVTVSVGGGVVADECSISCGVKA